MTLESKGIETNKKMYLFNGPIMIGSYYENHEKCTCMPPFPKGYLPTSNPMSHNETCPLWEILWNKMLWISGSK